MFPISPLTIPVSIPESLCINVTFYANSYSAISQKASKTPPSPLQYHNKDITFVQPFVIRRAFQVFHIREHNCWLTLFVVAIDVIDE